MFLKGMQERAVWLIAGLSKKTLILSVLVKIVDLAEGKEGHSFLETPLVVHPLLGWEFQLGKQLKMPAFNCMKSFRRE